ncbi:hypothetical protein BW730_11975 [Tessaracoccus aquimaris]|uniref:Mannose-6-phosphate isomerase n=1 Tax=Tessaracoccus aquimaris TaxID=1332264 RepID=A0A1Q2CPQ3_9ACTN|nr:hypothetical protein [Tessaracoccus aquimaris]AQP48101.1 hypothetical protein BW730_11975 [Tessaracoccus aquimaris]
MPLYEFYDNALNVIPLSDEQRGQVSFGTDAVVAGLADRVERGGSVGIDGWYGVDWRSLIGALTAALSERGIEAETVSTAGLYLPQDEIATYQATYETDDPSFGWVNSEGTLQDLLDQGAVEDLRQRLTAEREQALIVYGPGACVAELQDAYDLRAYADFTMQPMLWQMWGGELVPFGSDEPAPDYAWKKYYYNDFYLLYRQKKQAFQTMDLYLSAVHSDALVAVPTDVYNHVIDELVKRPIKQVKILQPGPWGAYRYKDLWDVPGLEANAWNELAGIELSILVDLGGPVNLNMPTQNIMQRPVQLVGQHVNDTYPDLFPLQVWLDDGYFPKPVPFERSSMPIHDHPSTDYVREHFNEPLGRYETYYIIESYKGSSTWMGYKEDADLEEWERLCRASENQVEIPNWQDYVSRWDTNVGDLFLIPPGTTHGHGGNQMILELDTGPSVAGTEYSFFTYDFARPTWDDETKTMTGKPMKMHTKHSFDNHRFIRENRVRSHHRARPITVDGDGKFRKDQYTSLPEMPFHIERVFMEHEAVNDTEGRFMHIATLAEGKRVTVRSVANPDWSTTIDRFQSCIIPAGMGEHVYVNEDGSHALVVIIRLKEG